MSDHKEKQSEANWGDSAITETDLHSFSEDMTYSGVTSFLRRPYRKDLEGIDVIEVEALDDLLVHAVGRRHRHVAQDVAEVAAEHGRIARARLAERVHAHRVEGRYHLRGRHLGPGGRERRGEQQRPRTHGHHPASGRRCPPSRSHLHPLSRRSGIDQGS